jgi:energy-coupling factor transport system permease protein
MLWILVSVMVFHIFLSDYNSSKSLLSVGAIEITWKGIRVGVKISFQFLIVVLGATLLTLTTMPLQIADGITGILSPLRKIGLPLHQFSLMILIILHFVPLLFMEAEKLMMIQKARGRGNKRKNVIMRLKALASMLIALLRNSLQKADNLAVGMEARCYSGGARTHLYGLKFRRIDVIALSIVNVILPAVLVVNRIMSGEIV